MPNRKVTVATVRFESKMSTGTFEKPEVFNGISYWTVERLYLLTANPPKRCETAETPQGLARDVATSCPTHGRLVQKSRMPACHAGGHGFESRSGRHMLPSSNRLRRPDSQSGNVGSNPIGSTMCVCTTLPGLPTRSRKPQLLSGASCYKKIFVI